MPNAPAHPWKMFIPLGAVLVLALVWSIYWFAAMEVAQQRFSFERRELETQGLSLTCDEESWGGFPFHFEFNCSTPVIRIKDQADLKSSKLLLVALAYAPWQVTALIDGPSTLSGPDISAADATHQRIMAVLTYEGEGKARFSGEVRALSIPGIGKTEMLMVHSRPSASGGNDVALSLTGLSYEPEDGPPATIDQAEALATILPDTSLKLDKVDVQQGGLRLWGSGTVSLDTERRPAGRVDMQTNDANRLLEVISSKLQLTEQQVSNIRLMLGLLGNEAEAAIIAKDGILYVGPFAVATLKPLY
jgi:hypothetical protein